MGGLAIVPDNILLAHLLAAHNVTFAEIGKLPREQINHLRVDICISEQVFHATAPSLMEPVAFQEEGGVIERAREGTLNEALVSRLWRRLLTTTTPSDLTGGSRRAGG